MEVLGKQQSVLANTDVVFDTVDRVGNCIELNTPGTTATIKKTGLYHIEWSLNLATDNENMAEYGLLQNGVITSTMANSALVGNISSGALINVKTVPFTISLNNHGKGENKIEGYVNENAAASLRIARFADGPLE